MKSNSTTTPYQEDIFGFVWRHKAKLTACFLLGVAITLAYLSLAKRFYRSEAKIFVRLGRESISLDPTATTGELVSIAETRESEVYAVDELLKSRGLAERVVDEFSPGEILEKDPDKPGLSLDQKLESLNKYNLNPLRVYNVRDKAIRAFQKNLDVLTANKTSVVSVAYKSEDPKKAQEVLNAVIDFARDEHLKSHRTTGSQQFFVEQSELLKSNLAQLESQLRDLKSETGLASLPMQRELQLKLIDSLESDLLKARAEQKASQAEIAYRHKQLVDMPALVVTERTTGVPQDTRQSMREKLYDLEVKEQELAAKLSDVHPQLMEIRNQIGEVRKIFVDEGTSEQVTTGINKAHEASELAVQDREAVLASLDARTKSLETTIASVRDSLNELNDSELNLNRLEREVELARVNYRKHSENLEQSRINQALEDAKISSINLMQEPTYSETPVSPKPLVTLAVGFVASVIGSFGVALLAEYRTNKKRAPAPASTPNSNEPLSVPALPTEFAWRGEAVPANPR